MIAKKAIITGVTGQDGSYLAEFLLEKGYEVHGIIRRSSTLNTSRIEHLYDNPNLVHHYGDLTDGVSIFKLVSKIQPDEIYNLGAQTHVRLSFDAPNYTSEVDYIGALNLLEAIRNINPSIKFYQASSSELFGNEVPPQNERTLINPVSPYGIAKAGAYMLTRMYREAYGIFTCNGILFNHESPRRSEMFVSRKISKGVARIKQGLQAELTLGCLTAFRDWGYAPDFVEGIYKIMQHRIPSDFVLATGASYSVKHFVDAAFKCVDLDPRQYVKFDERLLRAIEVDHLRGDYTKAFSTLNWSPKVRFNDLVKLMVEAELNVTRELV